MFVRPTWAVRGARPVRGPTHRGPLRTARTAHEDPSDRLCALSRLSGSPRAEVAAAGRSHRTPPHPPRATIIAEASLPEVLGLADPWTTLHMYLPGVVINRKIHRGSQTDMLSTITIALQKRAFIQSVDYLALLYRSTISTVCCCLKKELPGQCNGSMLGTVLPCH